MTDRDNAPAGDVVFYEEQRPWRGYVTLGVVSFGALAAVSAYAIFAQLILRRPFCFGVMSDGVLAIVGSVAVVVGVLGMIATCKARLAIEVRPDGVFVQYVPFHLRPQRIALDHVVSVKAVTYWPIMEFGGWGICWTRYGGQAYTAHGNRGVRISYVSGRYLQLGSQRPEELAEAIKWFRQNGREPQSSPVDGSN